MGLYRGLRPAPCCAGDRAPPQVVRFILLGACRLVPWLHVMSTCTPRSVAAPSVHGSLPESGQERLRHFMDLRRASTRRGLVRSRISIGFDQTRHRPLMDFSQGPARRGSVRSWISIGIRPNRVPPAHGSRSVSDRRGSARTWISNGIWLGQSRLLTDLDRDPTDAAPPAHGSRSASVYTRFHLMMDLDRDLARRG